ncbi:hypothetical protein D9M70_392350 [compost metagenome]
MGRSHRKFEVRSPDAIREGRRLYFPDGIRATFLAREVAGSPPLTLTLATRPAPEGEGTVRGIAWRRSSFRARLDPLSLRERVGVRERP